MWAFRCYAILNLVMETLNIMVSVKDKSYEIFFSLIVLLAGDQASSPLVAFLTSNANCLFEEVVRQ